MIALRIICFSMRSKSILNVGLKLIRILVVTCLASPNPSLRLYCHWWFSKRFGRPLVHVLHLLVVVIVMRNWNSHIVVRVLEGIFVEFASISLSHRYRWLAHATLSVDRNTTSASKRVFLLRFAVLGESEQPCHESRIALRRSCVVEIFLISSSG